MRGLTDLEDYGIAAQVWLIIQRSREAIVKVKPAIPNASRPNHRSRCGLSLVVAALYAMMIGPAHAYLDPGSGALLVQGLIAAVAGGLIAVRQVIGRVLIRLKGLRSIVGKNEQAEKTPAHPNDPAE